MRDEAFSKAGNPLVIGSLFFLLLLGMGVFSHLVYDPHSRGFHWAKPRVVSGDEPHYLMAVKSILFDHDLEFQEDYRRKEYQGLEHHTILVDPATGKREWAVLYDTRHPSMRNRTVLYCKPWDCSDPTRMDPRFPDPSRIIERNAHPMAYPALIAALLAPTRPEPSQVEGRMQVAVLIISWMASILIYCVARKAGLSKGVSLSGSALLILGSPWLAYSRSFYSEAFSGFFLILGLWGMQARKPVVAALAVWAAAAIKPIFILMGAGWMIERCWSRQYREAVILFLILTVGGLGICAFNYWQAKTIFIAGHLKGEQVWAAPNPFPTLLNSRWGLLAFAPWTIVALYAAVRSLMRPLGSSGDLLLRQIAIPTLLYWGMLSFHKYFGQSCYGCRYWVPLLPWLALATLLFVSQAGKVAKAATLLLAELGFLIAVSGALSYPFMFDKQPLDAFRVMFSGMLS